MSPLLPEKVALITGAASGIGRATALVFADEGAKLVLADVDDAGGAETVRLVEERGGEAVFVACDVSSSARVEGLVRAGVERFGRLDCAFNNAGIGGDSARLADYEEEAWNRVIAVNLTGVFL
ncbi:MAG: SDR family NAD(P)-dependent oxidoreductase, partial [Gaiellaceae bacterium]